MCFVDRFWLLREVYRSGFEGGPGSSWGGSAATLSVEKASDQCYFPLPLAKAIDSC